jgi:ribonuclease Z
MRLLPVIRRRLFSSHSWSFRGLDLEFLGTGSCTPTAFRNVACTAVRMASQDWLIDCGEGTQLQVNRSNSVTSSKINRICITHRHGDHVFGLPGLIHTVAGDASEANVSQIDDGLHRDIEVVGPVGLASFVAASLAFTGSRLKSRVVVVELAADERPLTKIAHNVFARQAKPNGDGVWELGPGDGVPDSALLYAARIRHTAPCWGYLIVEPDSVGAIDVDKCKALGLQPGPLYKQLKDGKSLLLKNGTVVRPEDVIAPSSRGRRVAVLGDTDSGYQSLDVFKGVDVLVHDCTLPPDLEDAKSRATGHSGPRIAGEFARDIGAGHLFLSHIGRRIGWYKGGQVLKRVASDAMQSKNVTVANDFDVFSVNLPCDFDALGVVTKRASRADIVLREGELSDAELASNRP